MTVAPLAPRIVPTTPFVDQQPGTSAPLQRKPDAAMHELEWIQDGMRLTLRSTLPAAELERLRQLVR